MPVPLSGNIKQTPLPDVLEELRVLRATGTLEVLCEVSKKSVYFKDGQIIFAASTDAGDRLGEMLVKTGKLSRENLNTALKIHNRTAGIKKLGAIFVENGFVSPKDLFSGLKTQIKEIIYSLFLLEAAKYHFEVNLPPDTIQLQINIQELIVEIIQRIKQEA